MDGKWQRLAEILVNYSTRVQPGEIALVHCIDEMPEEFISSLIDKIYGAGGGVLLWLDNSFFSRQLVIGDNERALAIRMEGRLEEIKKVQVVFHLFSEGNVFEFSDVPADKLAFSRKLNQPISDWRCNKTKRVLTCLPNKAAAQLAGMSTAQFDQFYFNVCLGVDYPKMSESMDFLVARMQAADQVQITGPFTSLAFSIKGIPAIKCAGEQNFPDGEVFTAPVKDSVNGQITFNTPTVYSGKQFGPMTLTYKDGRLQKIICSDPAQQKKAEEILHSDEGAQYIGEFAFGLNPQVIDPVGEILFDEKIRGSIHVTPGSCYEEASNGNEDSAIHWDMILRQTPECGGGEIYFDGELIRKDGLFLGELAALNPDNLKV